MTKAELKKARDLLHMTQAELAKKLGMQRNSVVRMEMGIQPIMRTTELAVRYLLSAMSKKTKGRKRHGNK